MTGERGHVLKRLQKQLRKFKERIIPPKFECWRCYRTLPRDAFEEVEPGLYSVSCHECLTKLRAATRAEVARQLGDPVE
jgi:hypothetical protein